MLAEQRSEYLLNSNTFPNPTFVEDGSRYPVAFRQQELEPQVLLKNSQKPIDFASKLKERGIKIFPQDQGLDPTDDYLEEPIDFIAWVEHKRSEQDHSWEIQTLPWGFDLEERKIDFLNKPSYLLPGIGFDVRGQTNMLIRDLQTASKEGRNFQQTFFEWVDQTVIDIKEATDELLKDRLIFSWDLVKEVGSNRFKDRKYNKYWDDCVANEEEGRSFEERWGSIRKANEKAKNLLIDGKMVGIMSGKGRTNLPNGQGGEVLYQDAYLTLGKGYTDEAKMVTIKLSLDPGEWEDIVRKLILEGEVEISRDSTFEKDEILKMSEEERIINTVQGVCRFKEGQTFQGILDRIRILGGKKFAWEGTVQKNDRMGRPTEVEVAKSYDEIFWELENQESLKVADEVTKFHLTDFVNRISKLTLGKDYASCSYVDLDKFENLIGEIFKNLTIAFKGQEFLGPEIAVNKFATYYSPEIYKLALEYLQTRPGCAGGAGLGTHNRAVVKLLSSDFDFFRAIDLTPKRGICKDCGEGGTVADCDICRKCQENYDDYGRNYRQQQKAA